MIQTSTKNSTVPISSADVGDMILSKYYMKTVPERLSRGGVIEFQPALSLTQAFADDLRRTKVI